MKSILFFILFAFALSSCNFIMHRQPVDMARIDSVNLAQARRDSIAAYKQYKQDSAKKGYRPHFTTYMFDTSDAIPDSPRPDASVAAVKPKHWSELQDFWSVYRFGDNLYCIGIQLSDDTTTTVIDSLFHETTFDRPIYDSANHDHIIDTTVAAPLQENMAFTSAMLHNDNTRSFYVYCTRGITAARVTRVLYHLDACVYYVAIQLETIDTAKYGMPLIASKDKINLTYGTIPAFQHDLEEFHSYKYGIVDGDYTWVNPAVPHLFAYNDSLFFTYTDNFNYYNSEDSQGDYPGRMIFINRGKKVSLYSDADVDFFGIGCD